MTKGSTSMFISLTVLFLLCISLAFIVRLIAAALFPEMNLGLFDQLWMVFLEMTDPGNMYYVAPDPNPTSALLKWSTIFSGMIGIVIFSMLIAFITTQLTLLMTELKKGHSRVLEKDHTLILGWSDRVPDIVRELIIANESEKSASIVILTEQDNEKIHDELFSLIEDTKTTHIITRSGIISSLSSLERVNAKEAKSAIVLAKCSENAEQEEKQASDARAIKAVLALIAIKGDNAGDMNIVAEIFDEKIRQTLDVFESDNIVSIEPWNILGKILVQTTRTSGLAVVYNEILSFDGCELYFYGEDVDFGGRKFYDILYHFPDGVPMGIRRANGELIIRPDDPNTRMEEGDEILILAEDDSTIKFRENPVVVPGNFTLANKRVEGRIEKQLILGWHPIILTVIPEYADYLVKGSSVDVMVNNPSDEIKSRIKEFRKNYGNLNISLIDKNPMNEGDIRSVKPFKYDNVIILSQPGKMIHDSEKIDSETIVILLILRKIFKENEENEDNEEDKEDAPENRKTQIFTQIMNSSNQSLISHTDVDDFIISNRLITMIMAQLSEEPGIKSVYDDLFCEEGSEIYIKPAQLYFEKFPVDVTFADIIGISHKRNEICIGVRLKKYERDSEKNFGVKLIPPKDKKYTLNSDDYLVVLAEDEL
ncbi:hypothetical protein BEH94_05525 [Candidatus Altiarchaeales archaeon WOR_SM1_SCG]|nr:hypothetical protein BEH94_05525 [Candidatus Altiarchaeales archaeon WOR_SM1_SCG]